MQIPPFGCRNTRPAVGDVEYCDHIRAGNNSIIAIGYTLALSVSMRPIAGGIVNRNQKALTAITQS